MRREKGKGQNYRRDPRLHRLSNFYDTELEPFMSSGFKCEHKQVMTGAFVQQLDRFNFSDFRKSVTLKAFAICFVATHVPLLAITAVLVFGNSVNALFIFFIALLATLTGTAFCLYSIYRLFTPIKSIVASIETYGREKKIITVKLDRDDEIGRLATSVSALLFNLDDSMNKLKIQADSDSLTGLGNRRWLYETVNRALAKAKRDDQPISVVIFDLDHFKSINDEFGHMVGDEILVAVSNIAHEHCRPYDILARIGGEEFCMVLPDTAIDAAFGIAERIRKAVETSPAPSITPQKMTASFGVYAGDPHTETFRAMFDKADENLYAAKRAGRNRVSQNTSLPSSAESQETLT